MTRRSALPPSIDGLPFSRAMAVVAGVSDSRMRGADLTAPHRGARRQFHLPDDIYWRASTYQRVMPAGALFSHQTAARLYALPLPLYVGGEAASALHVTVHSGGRPPVARGIVGHELDGDHWSASEILHHDYERGELFLLPIVPAALAWAQLAPILDRADLVAIGDAILAAKPPLATIQELVEMADAWQGRRGARALAWASRRLRSGCWSRPETLFRLMESAAGIPEPELNVEVFDPERRSLSTPDQSWPDYRVLLEYEGDGHRSRGKFRSDITRYENYADGKWTLVRVHADDVFGDPNVALARLSRRLMERGWRPRRRELRVVAPARR